MSASLMCRPALLAAVLALASLVPAAPPRFPDPPSAPGRFGAFHTKLSTGSESWDAQWRFGPEADVVVVFDRLPARLIFWRGTNFTPCWVNDRQKWYSDGSLSRPNGTVKQDVLCKYSHPVIVESNDARVVVHWRYAPVDAKGQPVNADPMTNWNDWVDEVYTLYPDGAGVRRMKLFSSVWDQPVLLQESTVLHAPGSASKDDVRPDPLTRATRTGTSQTVAGGANGPVPFPSDPAIQVVNLAGGGRLRPFQIPYGPAARVVPAQPQKGAEGRNLNRDWPMAGKLLAPAERPSSTVLDTLEWPPSAQEPQSRSWMMLTGMTAEGPEALLPLADSWNQPPALAILSDSGTGGEYNAGDRAYELAVPRAGQAATVRFRIEAGEKSPLFNPGFVIRGWGRRDASLTLDGRPVPRGPDFRFGLRKTSTFSDLVVWVALRSTKPVTLEIKPL